MKRFYGVVVVAAIVVIAVAVITWLIELDARPGTAEGVASMLTFTDGPKFPSRRVWLFNPRPQLRLGRL